MIVEWWRQPCKPLSEVSRQQAQTRQAQLTKPAGSLARLEQVAIELAAMQGREKPRIDTPWISIFAGDHGVVAEGISAYPQAVTAQMLRNFVAGGAAISVLARHAGAALEVVDLGTVELLRLAGVRHLDIGRGTANFARQAAMSEAQLDACLQAGRDSALRASVQGADLFIGGEMGIGNTTAAAAIACALLHCSATELAGAGTGLDNSGVMHKANVIEQALLLHRNQLADPLQVLRCLGGFEVAALVGAYLGCAQQGITVLVDGFICTVAALLACRLNEGCRAWLLFAHQGAEKGHQRVLQALSAEPLLDLGLRLGEGSGAGVALPLLRSACQLHGEMATFSEAAVADREA